MDIRTYSKLSMIASELWNSKVPDNNDESEDLSTLDEEADQQFTRH
ncbi:unnamed protein product, partial [Didymodactylos carnosus]